jgi:SlyX protein
MDDRIVELETRLTFQEEHLETLSRTLSHQQQLIDELRQQLDEMHERLKDVAIAALTFQGTEAPPHY